MRGTVLLGASILSMALAGTATAQAPGAPFPPPGARMQHPPMPPAPRAPMRASPRWGSQVGGRWWGGVNAPGGWAAYRQPFRGYRVPTYWIAPRFYVTDWSRYGLYAPTSGYSWVRYYDDAVLVDERGGVRDWRGGLNWDAYAGGGGADMQRVEIRDGDDDRAMAGHDDHDMGGHDHHAMMRDDDRRGPPPGYRAAPPMGADGSRREERRIIIRRPDGAGGPPPMIVDGGRREDRRIIIRRPDGAGYPPPPMGPGSSFVTQGGNTIVTTTRSGGGYSGGAPVVVTTPYGSTVTTITIQSAPVVTTTTTTEIIEDAVTWTRPARRVVHQRAWHARPKTKLRRRATCACGS